MNSFVILRNFLTFNLHSSSLMSLSTSKPATRVFLRSDFRRFLSHPLTLCKLVYASLSKLVLLFLINDLDSYRPLDPMANSAKLVSIKSRSGIFVVCDILMSVYGLFPTPNSPVYVRHVISRMSHSYPNDKYLSPKISMNNICVLYNTFQIRSTKNIYFWFRTNDLQLGPSCSLLDKQTPNGNFIAKMHSVSFYCRLKGIDYYDILSIQFLLMLLLCSS